MLALLECKLILLLVFGHYLFCQVSNNRDLGLVGGPSNLTTFLCLLIQENEIYHQTIPCMYTETGYKCNLYIF